jgi:hypothetical protein
MVTGEYKGVDTTFVTQMFGTPKTTAVPKPKTAANPDKIIRSTAVRTQATSKTNVNTVPAAMTASQAVKKPANAPVKQPITAKTENVLTNTQLAKNSVPPAVKAPILPEPAIVAPEDKTLMKESEIAIRVYAPQAQKVNIIMDGALAAEVEKKDSEYFEAKLVMENGSHSFTAVAYGPGQEKYSKSITATLDEVPPQIDLDRSSISIKNNDNEQELVSVTAMLSADTVKAQASFNNYNIELKPDPFNLNRWSGQMILFSEKGEETLNPVVPASITATDRAGSTVTSDIMWENILPLRQSLVNQYFYLKNNQSPYSKLLFDISSSFYKILIIMAIVVLGVNIFMEIHKKHPHLIYSTVGLVVLLAILIII